MIELRAGEFGAMQHRAREIGAGEVGVAQIATFELGLLQVAAWAILGGAGEKRIAVALDGCGRSRPGLLVFGAGGSNRKREREGNEQTHDARKKEGRCGSLTRHLRSSEPIAQQTPLSL